MQCSSLVSLTRYVSLPHVCVLLHPELVSNSGLTRQICRPPSRSGKRLTSRRRASRKTSTYTLRLGDPHQLACIFTQGRKTWRTPLLRNYRMPVSPLRSHQPLSSSLSRHQRGLAAVRRSLCISINQNPRLFLHGKSTLSPKMSITMAMTTPSVNGQWFYMILQQMARTR